MGNRRTPLGMVGHNWREARPSLMRPARGAAQPLSHMPAIAAGRYVLLEKLGEGGMGVVYRAEDRSAQRTVAIKQLLSGKLGSERRTTEILFEREYHTLARLKHPSIIEVYDYGVVDTGPYYTMEILAGKDLRELAPLPFVEVCRHLRDVASSLALLHTHRLVHRDLSPRNVRITSEGQAKLLDFGALTSFGRPDNIIGTPPYVAPEVLRQMPVDQRADLFALGALAYWALTGRNAFPARRLDDLFSLWISAPPRPSTFGRELPPQLDDLVMSLLSIDPLGRPASAAEVIDRLSAIGGLPALTIGQTVEGYLVSGKLVGRQAELDWMSRRLARLSEGRGTLGLIEGHAGVGKTRLLDELALEALLKGLRVLRVDARAAPGAFGAAAALAEAALVACPDLAVQTGTAYAAQLGQLSPAVRKGLAADELAPPCEDPGEERARMQTALHDWFLAMAKSQRLMLAVDNVELADAGTAAFLAALGKAAPESGLMLLATCGPIPEGSLDGSLRALKSESVRKRLDNLSAEGCKQLCVSLFGDVANIGRLAAMLHDKSGGNPQLCTELSHLLVKRQIVKYVGGTWVLPQELSADELPDQMEQVVHDRLMALPKSARQLAEALCVFSGAVSLDHVASLLGPDNERSAFEGLDALIAESLLINDGSSYRFAHESLRGAVYTLLDADARKACHLRASQVILARNDLKAVQRIEAGSHLLKAGEESRGAELLAKERAHFTREGNYEASPDQVLRALHVALQVFERQGRSDEELAEVLFGIVPISFLTDWRLNLQYAERTLQAGLRVTGLSLAQRLQRFLPRSLALAIALGITGAKLKYKQLRGHITYDLPEAIAMFCTVVPPAVATSNICYDIATVKRMVDRLEPLAYFGKGHIASLMRDFAIAQLRMGQSRELDALNDLELMEQRYRQPKVVRLMGEELWRALYGGVLFSQGVLKPYWFGDQALEIAGRMEQLGFNIWQMAADQVRLLHHALRGESEQVRHYGERVELFAVRGGTTWQAEMFWPVLLLSGTVLNGDTIGVRRLWEQLRRRAKDAPGLRSYARAARACYVALRGEHAKAIRLFSKVLPKIPLRERVAWHTLRAIFAGILNDVGQHARAKEVLLETLAQVRPGEEAVVGRHLELVRQLALAEAGLGQIERGADMLDQLLTEHAGQDQPLLLGLLHKARAEIALRAKDPVSFERHLGKMGQCFRATQNPALVAQWETLVDRGARKNFHTHAVLRGSADSSDEALIQDLASRAGSTEEAHVQIVSMLAARARAEEAHLYAWTGREMRLVGSTRPDLPPGDLETALNRAAIRAASEAARENTATATGYGNESTLAESMLTSAGETLGHSAMDRTGPPSPQVSYQTFVLSHWSGERFEVVGALAIKLHSQDLCRLDPSSLASAAAAMYARRDGAPTVMQRGMPTGGPFQSAE